MKTIPLAPFSKLEAREKIREMIESNEEWRLMKVIVLGNGRIGKTTFIHFLQEMIAPQQV